MTLDKIESLFKGLKDCQVYLCEQLFQAKYKMEAKGVFDRSELNEEEWNKHSKSYAGQKLQKMKYNKEMDHKPLKDLFEPISLPANEHLILPSNIKFEFIDSEHSISKLKVLEGQRFIGVDAEWRP